MKRVCNPEAARLEVSATGVVYLGERLGWVVDCDGVGGTGRTNTLILASSPAVKYRKSPSFENCLMKLGSARHNKGRIELTARPSGERSQLCVSVNLTFLRRS